MGIVPVAPNRVSELRRVVLNRASAGADALQVTITVLERRGRSTSVTMDDTKISSYRPDVDGLRAVAIVLVVLYHCGVPGFRNGFIGVDIFFVISGFVITAGLASEI